MVKVNQVGSKGRCPSMQEHHCVHPSPALCLCEGGDLTLALKPAGAGLTTSLQLIPRDRTLGAQRCQAGGAGKVLGLSTKPKWQERTCEAVATTVKGIQVMSIWSARKQENSWRQEEERVRLTFLDESHTPRTLLRSHRRY